MKRYLFLLLPLFFYNPICAQREQTNRGNKELGEKIFGWSLLQPSSGNINGKKYTAQGRSYSSDQLGLANIFIDWIKKSYMPIGGLPQFGKYALPDCKTNCPYIPNGVGVSFQMWKPCYTNTGTKIIKAQPASHEDIQIFSNYLPGITSADSWINNSSLYIFTLYYSPTLKLISATDQKSIQPKLDQIANSLGLKNNYFIYLTAGGDQINVILTPLSKMPIHQLTKAEVLDKGAEAIQRALVSKDITDWQHREYTEAINFLKEKHKKTLTQPAFIKNEQLTIYSFNKDPDLFEQTSAIKYMFPVYSFEESVYSESKKTIPIWLNISFPFYDSSKTYSKTATKEIYNSMLHNFNYQYVYDYFFNPEIIKSKPYTIRNQNILESNLKNYQKID